MSEDSAFRPHFTISDVERDTGIAKETLRVWERRYGFPQPQRDANDERVYPAEQVQRLLLVRRLMDLGHRPGKLMTLDTASLTALAAESVEQEHCFDPALATCLDMVRRHQTDALRQHLTQSAVQMGLQRFVNELAAPLIGVIGDAWAKGQLAVFEEHLFSEVLQVVLRNAIFSLGHRGRAPRVLLTTVPQERHTLGLLMAEAMLALEGAHCLSLGVATPVPEIVAAAQAQGVDVVALSFSSAVPARTVGEAMVSLRQRLPEGVGLWAGGAGARLAERMLPEGVSLLDLQDIQRTIGAWRSAH